MAIATGEQKIGIGTILAAVGGVLGIVQAVLAWETITLGPAFAAAAAGFNLKTSASGLDENGGKVILALGVVALALAVASIAKIKVPSVAVILTVAGAIMVGLALLGFIGIQKDINDFNTSLDALKGAMDMTGTSASIGIGLIVAGLGGVLVLAGGILDLRNKTA